MKNLKLLAAGLALLAGFAYTASGATNGLVLGQNVQSVIDASAPGDTLVVQPGVYPDASLVFNKPLTVLPSGTNGDSMQFLGTVQVTGAGASSFQRAYFVNSVQTTGSTVSFFDTTFNANVTVTGGKVTMKRTILNYPLTIFGNASLDALRMTNNAIVTATANVGSGTPFLAVQSWFTNAVYLSGYKVWLGYNIFTNTGQLLQTNCDSVLVGNKFSGKGTATVTLPVSTPVIIYSEGGSLKAYNNLINGNFSPGLNNNPVIGMWLKSNVAEIVNNTIYLNDLWNYTTYCRGIYADNGTGPVTVRGSIISLVSMDCCPAAVVTPIFAETVPGQSVFLSYCDFLATNANATHSLSDIVPGVVPPPVNCLVQVNPNLATDGSLTNGSPCLNAGPPDAIYNNRDGTRNTMGYTGGPYWNPANYTNNNPMVFLLTGQQVVLNGVQTSIQVNAAASAGH